MSSNEQVTITQNKHSKYVELNTLLTISVACIDLQLMFYCPHSGSVHNSLQITHKLRLKHEQLKKKKSYQEYVCR